MLAAIVLTLAVTVPTNDRWVVILNYPYDVIKHKLYESHLDCKRNTAEIILTRPDVYVVVECFPFSSADSRPIREQYIEKYVLPHGGFIHK